MKSPMDVKDIEANRFAEELLMPRRMVLRLLDERPGITARELAELFEVSESDMTKRLVRLRHS